MTNITGQRSSSKYAPVVCLHVTKTNCCGIERAAYASGQNVMCQLKANHTIRDIDKSVESQWHRKTLHK